MYQYVCGFGFCGAQWAYVRVDWSWAGLGFLDRLSERLGFPFGRSFCLGWVCMSERSSHG